MHLESASQICPHFNYFHHMLSLSPFICSLSQIPIMKPSFLLSFRKAISLKDVFPLSSVHHSIPALSLVYRCLFLTLPGAQCTPVAPGPFSSQTGLSVPTQFLSLSLLTASLNLVLRTRSFLLLGCRFQRGPYSAQDEGLWPLRATDTLRGIPGSWPSCWEALFPFFKLGKPFLR